MTAIGDDAFRAEGLTSVTLPDILRSIGDGAFQSNELTTVAVPYNVTDIGSRAFADNQLTTVTIGELASTIGDLAFGDNPQLIDVTFKGSAPTITPAGSLGSFGASNVDLVLYFPGAFAEGPDAPNGYSTPTWRGYQTILDDNPYTAPDGVTYEVNAEGDATVTSYSGIGGDVTILPSVTIRGASRAVTRIDRSAFAGSGLTSVTIPDSVTRIDDSAFRYNDLTSVTLPAGLISIGDNAFAANKLTSLTIPDSVTSAGEEAFSDNQLTSVDIGSGLTSLSSGIFTNNAISSVTIPDTITELDGFTFANNQLTSLVLGTGLTKTGDADFSGNLLTTVTLPASLTTIGDDTFFDNDLTAVTIPPSVTSIGNGAFADNELTAITIPDSVTEIGPLAFFRNKLASLTLGNGLTTIGENAFIYNEISTLTIPDSVTNIGEAAFSFNHIESITFGSGLTTIDKEVFSNNYLRSITIPAIITTIGPEAFGANGLDTVTFLGAAPAVSAAGNSGSFDDNNSDLLLDYPAQFGQPAIQNGFTMPTWQGYSTYITGTQPPVVPVTPPVTPPVNPTPPTPPTSGPSDPSQQLTAKVAGTKREYRTLVATSNAPAGTTVAYQWRADGKAIKGATSQRFKLTKAQAARRITVTVTAGGRTATSAPSLIVSSQRARLVVTPTRIGKRDTFRVTASGLLRGQKIRIWLGGRSIFVGKADSRGIVDREVRFTTTTDAGKRRVRVSGYSKTGKRTFTVARTVRYLSR